MSVSQKSTNMQMIRLMVYRRPLHPELFDLQARRTDRHGDYETESWLMPGGHVVRFNALGEILTEVVMDNSDHLPETGVVHALPCIGEKDYAMEPEDQQKLTYVTTVQTESLTDNLYQATLHEMRDFARETGALSYQYKEETGVDCLSLLDTQKYKREFHIQAYHLLGSSGMVLRTQSIFEVRQ